jgi:YidC/Oxa1 family membrane protein insertase
VSGVNFPIGVLLYWLTTNVWSMGQQFYVIRRNPTPGSPAADALERRRAARASRHPATIDGAAGETTEGAVGTATDPATEAPRAGGQRQQPRNPKKRPKKKP